MNWLDKIFLIVLLMSSFSIGAKGPKGSFGLKQVKVNSYITPKKFWAKVVEQANYAKSLHVFVEGKSTPILTHQTDFPEDNFKEAFVLKFVTSPRYYLYTTWNKGAHSERVIIFELMGAVKKIVFEHVSSWPVSFKVTDKFITINATSEMNLLTGTPKKVDLIWKPKTTSGSGP
ncbi:MAG: hypothetical protein ISR65_18340 [Bacteriovoracaceae bacterium]|nr:hypothetical protein [Bacteriovoracaceae bacterium]